MAWTEGLPDSMARVALDLSCYPDLVTACTTRCYSWDPFYVAVCRLNIPSYRIEELFLKVYWAYAMHSWIDLSSAKLPAHDAAPEAK